ncbi:hypothetical protein AJ79_06045 [Helicocarpus griseus UAMH5409]|uniref:Transcription factor domain-containing protein n=1 Tax=Helicocarpus griseus UAMH5409 TaxID=1447875 RepID=A0A2B7XH82_9EURO|nr:hypothetical protein AJ79_06045 [Helicocarpus griseus UAMH5409]
MGKAAVSGAGKAKSSKNVPPLSTNSSPRFHDPLPPNIPAPQLRVPNTAIKSSPSEPQGGPKSFEFVLVTDAESRKQVRRHAMRQYMRKRRLDGIARLESTRAQVRGWSIAGASEPPSSSAPRIEELDDNGNARGIKCKTGGPSSRGSVDFKDLDILKIDDDDDLLNNEEISAFLQEVCSADPKATPGSASLDPFNTYPLVLNRTDQNLIHHYVTTYPMMMYKMGDAHQNNPIKGIFHQLALHDALSFQAMLAISSRHLAGVEGRNESVQSLTHKMRALGLLNERLKSDVAGEHDGTIYAAATMAVIEKWCKDPAVERMHIRGLENLLRRRGGMRGMRATSPFLESVLYWVDFSCAPRAIMGASLPWTGEIPDTVPSSLPYLSPELHIPLAPPHHTIDASLQETSDILRACEDFLTFFRSLDALQRSLIASPPSPILSLQHRSRAFQSQRSNLFNASTPLYSILTTLPDYDHGVRDVRFIDEYTCMACLFYLNIALHDYYFTSRNFDHYLEWVTLELKKINPYSTPSISSLLWIFMKNGGYMTTEPTDKGERSWFVSRMLRVAKRLEWKRRGTSWDNLRRTLSGFVNTQQECGIGRDDITENEIFARQNRLGLPWEEDEMRKDILGPLYTGPPAFAMTRKPQGSNYSREPLTTSHHTGKGSHDSMRFPT